ncbi:MAG TPA: hypothetical protein VH583_11220 [Vicinamibacterales bacterium]
MTAVANDLALQSTGKIQVAREDLTRVVAAVALRPAGIVTWCVPGLPRISGTATERPGIVISITRVGLPPVAGSVRRIGVVATGAMVIEAEAFVVARILIARIEIKHGSLGAAIDGAPRGRTAVV